LIRAWAWLCANTDDLGEKRRCLEAILDLEPGNAWACEALERVLGLQQAVTDLHPANAEELANIAEETGAEVLRGPLRYPSESGGWQLGDMDFSEHLAKYRDHEVVVIIATIGKASKIQKEQYFCGVCGFALTELGECPRCRMQIEETAKRLRTRQAREELFREIGKIVEEGWQDSEQEDR
jgi:hypothetical protein